MAKLTIDEAKLKLQPVEDAIKALQGMNLAVPASLQQEYDRLVKIVTGKTSDVVASIVRDKFLSKVNENAEFVEFMANAIGTRAKITFVVKTAEDGKKSIDCEAGSGTGGGQKAGTSTAGGTKASTAYNNYEVTVIESNPNFADYAEKSFKTEVAAKAVEFILNKGKNAMNLGAEWQKGNSMVRALDGLTKNEAFNKYYILVRSYVQPTPTAEKPVAEAVAPTA